MGGLAWTDKASASQRVTQRGHREGSLFPDSRRCFGRSLPSEEEAQRLAFITGENEGHICWRCLDRRVGSEMGSCWRVDML